MINGICWLSYFCSFPFSTTTIYKPRESYFNMTHKLLCCNSSYLEHMLGGCDGFTKQMKNINASSRELMSGVNILSRDPLGPTFQQKVKFLKSVHKQKS